MAGFWFDEDDEEEDASGEEIVLDQDFRAFVNGMEDVESLFEDLDDEEGDIDF